MKRTTPKRKSTLKRSVGTLSKTRTKKAVAGQIKPNKKKSKSLSKYKKELDAVFSKYIRQIFPAKCYTCGVVKHRKNLQCGHFVSRMYLATRWEVDNCRPQCSGCNIWGAGKPLDFEENLKRDLGDVRVEEMKASRKQLCKLNEAHYLENIAYFKALLEKE